MANNNIWVEKYRPKHIDKIIKQDEIKQFLHGAILEKNIPHLLLYGPPGTGKTTITSVLIKHLFNYKKADFPTWTKFRFIEENKKLYNDRVLDLNASDERGIKIVREKIKTFANLSIVWQEKDKDIPPFKVIILDEADAMSNDSQFALRRIMEKYSHNTRFILICNYVTKIIPPLASRCSKFRFLPIDYESSKNMINNVLKTEGYNVNISEEIFTYIYQYTVGDLRKTITLFQRLSYIVKLEDLTIDIIRESIGEIPNDLVNEIISLLENKISIENQKNIFKIVKKLTNQSYNCLFLINHLYNHYLYDMSITDNIKSKIINKLSNIDSKLNNGSIEIIQIVDLLIYINSVYNNIDFNILNNPFTILIN
jgi:replication factor C subunit 2/4